MRGLSGWGNYPVAQAQLVAPRSESELQRLIMLVIRNIPEGVCKKMSI